MSERLVNQFQTELRRRGLDLPGSLKISSLGDLLWPPCGDINYIFTRDADPAFTVTGYSRWVAMNDDDEIRYFAGPIPEGVPPWWWSGEAPARVAAVKAETDWGELAILGSVADAVTFTVSYLGGDRFSDIGVVRIKPGPAARVR